jgi:hypothetical protein
MSTLLLAAGILRQLASIRPLYLAIWCGLGGLSVLLVLLMRSRWGQSHPLHRCAVLSLLVHLVLACLAMTVRLVVGDGGAGAGPPIQVRLVDDPTVAVPLALVTPPPLLDVEPTAEPQSDPAVKSDDAASSISEAPNSSTAADTTAEPIVEPPPLIEPAEIASSAPTDAADAVTTTDETAPVETTPESAPPIVEVESAVASPEIAPRPDSSTDVAANELAAIPGDVWAPADGAAAESPAVAALPTPYARRSPAERLQWAEAQGGSQQTEASVAAALKWLAGAQSADGRWDASRFGAGVEMAVLGQNRGGAGADADTGVSALALLALLGAGNTHQRGEYRAVVRSGLEFLKGSQAADGNLASSTGVYAQMYCHSMATFALAEALAMTGDPSLEPAVRRAAGYSIRAQHPATGGWRYRVGDSGDTSQLGWQLMALWSAERAGVDVPPQTWTGAERFLRTVRRGNDGGLASYRPDGPASTPMTAEGFYCRQLLSDVIGGGTDAAADAEATSRLLVARPDPSQLNFYYWYYATLALHHQQNTNDAAAQAWQAWNSALTTVLLDTQVASGPEAGSWHPNTVWGGYGGRVYTTAVAALSLEVYYRYAPAPADDPWMATRPQIRRLPQR